MFALAIEMRPGDYRIRGLLAEAYYWSPGRRDLAIEAFEQAIDLLEHGGGLDSANATHLSDLAGYYGRIGDKAKSEALLVEALRLEPSEWWVLFKIADTYEHLGRREEALKWIEKALEQGAPLASMDQFPGLRELRTDKRYRDMMDRLE
jgi:serine/threonine-protein kinase